MAEKRYINREASDKLYDGLGPRVGSHTKEQFFNMLHDDKRFEETLNVLKIDKDLRNALANKLRTPSEKEAALMNVASSPIGIDTETGESTIPEPKQSQSAIEQPEKKESTQGEVIHQTELQQKSKGLEFKGGTSVQDIAKREIGIENPTLSMAIGVNPYKPIGLEAELSKELNTSIKPDYMTDSQYEELKDNAEYESIKKRLEERNRQAEQMSKLPEREDVEKRIKETKDELSKLNVHTLTSGTSSSGAVMSYSFGSDIKKRKELSASLVNYENQLRMLEEKEKIEAADKDSTIKTWFKGAKDYRNLTDWATLGLKQIVYDGNLTEIKKKAYNGEQLSEDEIQTLNLEANLEEVRKNAPEAYVWGGRIANSVGFIFDLAFTSLLSGGAGGVLKLTNNAFKVGVKGARRMLLRRMGSAGIYTLATTPINPMFYKDLSASTLGLYTFGGYSPAYGSDGQHFRINMSKDDKSATELIYRSLASTFVESYTESLGDILMPTGFATKLLNKSKLGVKARRYLSETMPKTMPKVAGFLSGAGRATKAVNKFTRISSIPGETFEEVIGVPMNALFQWDKSQFYDERGKFTLFDPKFYLEIGVDSAILGGIGGAVGGAYAGASTIAKRKQINRDYRKLGNLLDTYNTNIPVYIDQLRAQSESLGFTIKAMKKMEIKKEERYEYEKRKANVDAIISEMEQSGSNSVPLSDNIVSAMDELRSFLTSERMTKDRAMQAYGMMQNIKPNPGTYEFLGVADAYIQTSLKKEGLIAGLTSEMENDLGKMAFKNSDYNSVVTVTLEDGSKWYMLERDDDNFIVALRNVNNTEETREVHPSDIKQTSTMSIEDTLTMWLVEARSKATGTNIVEATESVTSAPYETGADISELDGGNEGNDGSVIFKEGDNVIFGGTHYIVDKSSDGTITLKTPDGETIDIPFDSEDLRLMTEEEVAAINKIENQQEGVDNDTVTYKGKEYFSRQNPDGTFRLVNPEDGAVIDNVPQSEIENNNTENKQISPTPKEEKESYVPGVVSDRIKKQWEDSKKIKGFQTTKYIGDKKINVRYILTEQGAVTPSHDWHTFKPIPDFILDEKGNNANSRAYEQDSKKGPVIGRAANYNGKAFEDAVYVKDGAVISGNGRTMSGYLAAENGTDTQYINDLKSAAEQFGFTPEQVSQFSHPRVYAEILDDIPLTSDLFDAFNKPNTMGETMIDRAIAFGKKSDSGVIDSILNEIGQYEKMSEFYGSESSCDIVIGQLVNSGFINENQMPTYYDNVSHKFTPEGKSLLESALIGSVLNADMVRMLNAEKMGNVRQRVARTINLIVKNRTLDNYSLYDAINTAIQYIYDARSSGVSTFGFASHLLNLNMFSDKVYYTDAVYIALSLLKNDAEFKAFMNEYNTRAESMKSGELDFSEEGFNDFSKESFFSKKVNELDNKLNNEQDANERTRIQAELNAIKSAESTQQNTTTGEYNGEKNVGGGESGDNSVEVKTKDDGKHKEPSEQSEVSNSSATETPVETNTQQQEPEEKSSSGSNDIAENNDDDTKSSIFVEDDIVKSKGRADRIEDAGEKIGGARKDMIRAIFERINLNGESFSKIFPKFDYHKLIKEGLDPKLASGLKFIIDHAKKEYKVVKKRYNDKRAIDAVRFLANYAKGYITGDTSVDYSNRGWHFTDYGKRFYTLNTEIYGTLYDAIGESMFDIDLSGFSIDIVNNKKENEEARNNGESVSVYTYFRDGKEFPARYVVEIGGSKHSVFSEEEKEQAIDYFVRGVIDAISYDKSHPYKISIYHNSSDNRGINYIAAVIGGKIIPLTEKGTEYNLAYLKEHNEELQALAERKANERKEIRKSERNIAKVEITPFSKKEDKKTIYGYRFTTNINGENVPISDDFTTESLRDYYTSFRKQVEEYHKLHDDELQTKAQELLDGFISNRGWKPVMNIGNLRPRVGIDYREGRDISANDMIDTFGFRGIEFGNYVTQKERQKFMNECYDAFMDLADVLGISPKAISINGKLGLAIGARGRSGAKAHYEPQKNVINLTRKNGWGALAHEWWHAFDFYFGDNENFKPSTSGSFDSIVRNEMIDSINNLMKSINGSEYEQRSKNLDKKTGKTYYATDTELAARAFQDYVVRKLIERAQVNDFLSHFSDAKDWNGKAENYPYPIDDDATSISSAFEDIFLTIKERIDSSSGNVTLYDVSNENQTIVNPEINKVTTEAVTTLLSDAGVNVEMVSEEVANKEAGESTQYNIENDNKGNEIQFRTSDGIVYGYTKNGVIYLNSERLNPNTPIHEYTHLWDSACQQLNPELWRRGKELMKRTSVWNDVITDENYANIRNNEDAIASEVHSRLTGKKGAELLEKIANEGNTATEKITARGLIGKLKKWLNSFWKWTMDTFSPWSKEEADKVSLDEFVNMPIGDLVRGKNPNGPNSRRRLNQTENGFYSNAAKAVMNIKMEKATPQQWKNMLLNDGGLKAGEDKWIGLSEWLNSSDKKTLTKDEVIDFINNHTISVEEVNYPEKAVAYGYSFKEDFVFGAYIGNRKIIDAILDNTRFDYDKFEYQWEENYHPDSEEKKALDELNSRVIKANPMHSTRIKYTTEGLENKREIALTVPTIEPWNRKDDIHFGDAGEGRAIAWARFGDATTKDGKRVLFIDEIQSKRHQEGREKGYKGKYLISPNNISVNGSKIYYNGNEIGYTGYNQRPFSDTKDYVAYVKGQGIRVPSGTNDELKEVVARELTWYENINTIPAAPFEKNWHELAMKRMLRLAAEEGYDYVAWTSGEQQSKRYSLTKVVDKINRNDSLAGDLSEGDREIILSLKDKTDAIQMTVSKDGMITWSATRNNELAGNSLASVVGKGYAEKIMSMNDGESFEPSDELEFGGDGMRGFYDSILPKFMDKYGKKWGVKTEDMFIPGLEGNGVMAHTVHVTDAMKESVMQGQPMFEIRAKQDYESRQKAIRDMKDSNNIGRMNKLRERIFDCFNPVLDFMKEGRKLGVKSYSEDEDAYTAATAITNRAQGQINNYENEILKPLINAQTKLARKIKKLGLADTWDDAEKATVSILYALHAPERNKYITVREMYEYVWMKLSSDQRMLLKSDTVKDVLYQVCSDIYDNLFAGAGNKLTIDRYGIDPTRKIDLEEATFNGEKYFVKPAAGGAIRLLVSEITAETAFKKLMLAATRIGNKISKDEKENVRSGMTDKEANDILNEFSSPELTPLIEELKLNRNIATKFILDRWLEYGAISEEQYNIMRNMYRNYIPLRGYDETENIDWDAVPNMMYRGSTMVSLNKSAKGRSSIAGDPFAFMNQMALSAIIRGNRNRAKIKLFNYISKNADKVSSIAKIPKTYLVEDEEGNREVRFEKLTPLEKEKGWHLVRKEYDNRYKWHTTAAQIHEKMVPVDINGETYYIEFEGDFGLQVAKSIKNENRYQSPFTQKSTKAVNFMKAAMTGYNPKFWLKNFRDFPYAAFIYHLEHNIGQSLKYDLALFTTLAKVVGLKTGLIGSDTQTGRLYKEFESAGGATGYTRSKSIDDIKKDLSFMRARMGQGNMTKVSGAFVGNFIKNIVEALSSLSEITPRFAAYVCGIQNGLTPEYAANEARNITVDFSKKGTQSSFWDSLYVFFTPTLNAADRTISAVKGHPGKAAFDLAAMTAISYIIAVLAADNGDDGDDNGEERNNPYDNISDYNKMTNWLFWADGKFVSVPKPQNIRGAMNIAEQILDVQRGKKSFESAMFDWTKNIVADFSPLDFDAIDLTKNNFSESLVKFAAPSVFRPITELMMNEDFMGHSIYKEQSIISQKTLPQWKYAGVRTPEFYVDGARKLNNLFGGTDFRSARYSNDEGNMEIHNARALFDINPSYPNHIIQGYLGGFADLFDEFSNKSKWVDENNEVNYNAIPFANIIFKQPYIKKSYSEYFDIRDEVAIIDSELSQLWKNGLIPEYGKTYKANAYKVEIYKQYEKIINGLKKDFANAPDSRTTDLIQTQIDRCIDNMVRQYRNGSEKDESNVEKMLKDWYKIENEFLDRNKE